jgi:hypothetical protein
MTTSNRQPDTPERPDVIIAAEPVSGEQGTPAEQEEGAGEARRLAAALWILSHRS